MICYLLMVMKYYFFLFLIVVLLWKVRRWLMIFSNNQIHYLYYHRDPSSTHSPRLPFCNINNVTRNEGKSDLYNFVYIFFCSLCKWLFVCFCLVIVGTLINFFLLLYSILLSLVPRSWYYCLLKLRGKLYMVAAKLPLSVFCFLLF